MKTRFVALSMALLVPLAPLAVLAQSASSEGQVTKVDKPAARVTIKHQGVKNLDMPAMAMSFHVADAKMLDAVAAGDKVRFAASKIDGRYTLTALQKAN